MHPTVGFPLFLVLTVALLGCDVWTGLRAKRRQHLTLVALTIVSLGIAIYFAEQLGELYDLEAAGRIYPVHLAIAKIATAAYLLPIVTGIRLLRGGRSRRLHLRVAMLAIALTVTTAVTGTWMILAAERLPETPSLPAD